MANSTSSSWPPPIQDNDLPVTFRTTRDAKKVGLLRPSNDLETFLQVDLSMSKIDEIQNHLWAVGRPQLARPLNAQAVLDRSLIATTDISLHLVWTTKRMFLKPLPRYLLAESFYQELLKPPTSEGPAEKEEFRTQKGPALGFLYTYLTLMPTELDFSIARKHRLVPDGYDWQSWQTLTQNVLKAWSDMQEFYRYVPRRYLHGELRLSRLDKLYRLKLLNVHHGYSKLTGSTRYSDFFREYLQPIAAATVYIVVILSAMQVALQTSEASRSPTFQKFCFDFAYASIFLPILAVGLVFGMFVALFLVNWWKAVRMAWQRSADVLEPKQDGQVGARV